eukprot:5532360-Pyramimonas_sp.AAC.3
MSVGTGNQLHRRFGHPLVEVTRLGPRSEVGKLEEDVVCPLDVALVVLADVLGGLASLILQTFHEVSDRFGPVLSAITKKVEDGIGEGRRRNGKEIVRRRKEKGGRAPVQRFPDQPAAGYTRRPEDKAPALSFAFLRFPTGP